VAAGLVIFICDVPALKVKFEELEKSIAPSCRCAVTVLLFKFIVLVFEPVETSALTVKEYPAVSNVPLVTVKTELPDIVSASPNVTVIPAPLITVPLKFFPAVVSVPVPVIVISPNIDPVKVIPALSVILPATEM
jgi:hypothetical protein